MRLGIFAKTFQRPTLDGILSAIRDQGVRDVHFNLACAGIESLPADVSTELCGKIRACFTRHDLSMCGVSATFNAIHPDIAVRQELTRRACQLIEHSQDLGTQLVTLCTGTRSRDDMWAAHADNREPAAWSDLCATVETLLLSAERHSVVLGIEPERANVVDSASSARRLLDFFRTPHLKIVLDAANLFDENYPTHMTATMDEAFDLLGPDIVMAHAKDLPCQPGGSRTPSKGLLDWKHYVRGLKRIGVAGPLVLHGLDEREVPESLGFLARLNGRSSSQSRAGKG